MQVREAVYQRAQHIDATLIWLDADPTLLETYSAEAVAELRGQQLDALIAIYVAAPLATALLAEHTPLVHLSETATSASHMVAPVGLYDSARAAALFLAQQLGGRGELLVVGGLCDAGEAGRSRLAAITDVAHDFPALTITHIPCLWSPHLAQPQLAAALHGRTHAFAGILGLSDSLAMLARDVAWCAGLVQADTPVVGINGDPLALAAIAAGTMTATVETPAADFGFQAVDYACLLARNEPLPAPFGYQPQLVTAQNVAAVAVRKLIALAELPSRLVGVNREQEQRRLAQLEIGLEINRRVGGLVNRRQLSHRVADLIRTRYRYDAVQLLLWQPEQQVLLRDTPDAPHTPQQIVPAGALATALRDNRAVFQPNLRRAPPHAAAPVIGSRVVMPIRLGAAILGLLDMHNDAPIQLSRQDVAGLQSLADQLGVAMQNAELYEAALAAKAAAERADAIRTRLLANVSHEMRTPVNVILGYSQSILLTPDAAELPGAVLGDVEQIYGSGEHLIQLINDLLDMSRADVGELDLFPGSIDTGAFLRAVFESIARSAASQHAVAGFSLLLLLLIAPMTAYYIARHDNWFTRGLLVFFLLGLMVPPQVILIPITRVLRALGLMFTTPGLVLFNLGYYVPFAIFLYTGFIRTLPVELDEAAALDDAGPFRTFWTILFPLLRPCTASVVIFSGLWIWNDFLNPLIILGPLHGVTITTGIYTALGQFTVDYGQMFALMFLASVPVVVLFLSLQNNFISGLTAGAIKG